MKPSLFSKPAVFAAMPDPGAAAGAGAAEGLVDEEAQPAVALDRSARKSTEALFIVNRE